MARRETEIPEDLEKLPTAEAAALAKVQAVQEELRLGEAFIQAHRGQLWDAPAARPYLRLRMALACLLERNAQWKEARSHFEALLRFTPADPQRASLHLAHTLAQQGDLEALSALVAHQEPTPFWLWMKLLLLVRQEQLKQAQILLRQAQQANRHVLALLQGRARPRKANLEAKPHTAEHAAALLKHLAPAWSASREAMYWLMKIEAETSAKS